MSIYAPKMDWTDDLVQQLRTLWDEGHTTAEIGRRLGISKSAVVGKAHRLDLPARPSPIRRSGDVAVLAGSAGASYSGRRHTTMGEADGRDSPPVGSGSPVLPAAPAGRPSAEQQDCNCLLPPAASKPPVLAGSRSEPRRPAPPAAPCCWPIGEPRTPGFHFCGADALRGKPYCEEHTVLGVERVRDRHDAAEAA